MQNILGIILARSGSLGLPGKHLLSLLGRPVIEYTLDLALRSRRLTHVVLTTDCPKLREVAAARGVPSIDRPLDLATADASVQATCIHALQAAERMPQFPDRFDALAVLYGNVPVRPADVIDRAIDHLLTTGCDSVRSLTPVGKWHPAWMHRLQGDLMRPLDQNSIHRRQDLEPIYLHDGAAIACTRASLLRGLDRPHDPHAFFGDDRRAVVSEMDQTVEIDHRRDLYWAEAVLRDRLEAARQQAAAADPAAEQPERRRAAS